MNPRIYLALTFEGSNWSYLRKPKESSKLNEGIVDYLKEAAIVPASVNFGKPLLISKP